MINLNKNKISLLLNKKIRKNLNNSHKPTINNNNHNNNQVVQVVIQVHKLKDLHKLKINNNSFTILKEY